MTESDELMSAIESIKSKLLNKDISPDQIDTCKRIFANNPIGSHNCHQLIQIIDSLIKDPNYYQLDPEFLVIDLYEVLLSKVKFDEILELYPMDFIVGNLEQSNNQFTLLIIKILIQHMDEIDFRLHDLLYVIMNLYLGNEDCLISIISQIQLLLGNLPSSIKCLLNESNFQHLFARVKSTGNSTLISRLLDLIPTFINDVDFDLRFPLDLNDELFTLLVINFYEQLLTLEQESILSKISEEISTIIGLFHQRNSNDSIQMFLITDIVNFLATFSYKFPQHFPKSSILSPVKLYLDTSYDIQLLSKINPNTFPNDLVDYLIDFPLLNQRYFPILLNMVNVESISKTLIDHDKLTSNGLQSLSIDYLYKLLINMCNGSFNVNYLLNHCPTIMNDYIIDNIPSNSDIFGLKLTLLEKLLDGDFDLLIWKDRLLSTYKTMKYGRSIRANPQVDILDESEQ